MRVHGDQDEAERQGLLELLRGRGWRFYQLSRHGMGAVRHSPARADVVVLLADPERAPAYRTVLPEPGWDVFDPREVSWCFTAGHLPTLRAALAVLTATGEAEQASFPAPPEIRGLLSGS
ncbi:hypothetical protein GCM10010452_11170 [Crossiella cryophila]|uniref:hypothetical protein n=1 Tax=Crossiella cryophila TaxID=43355 RepID=UPI0031F131A1